LDLFVTEAFSIIKNYSTIDHQLAATYVILSNPSDKTFWDDSINQVTRHLNSYAVRLSKHLSCCLDKIVYSIYNIEINPKGPDSYPMYQKY